MSTYLFADSSKTKLYCRVFSLSSDVDSGLRTELQSTAKTLETANNHVGAILSLSRLSLKFMDLLFASVGEKRPSDNLYSCTLRASGGGEISAGGKRIEGLNILPRGRATYLELIRVLSNKIDHATEQTTLGIEDARQALGAFLLLLEWFYCDYPSGPKLKSIYSNRTASTALGRNKFFRYVLPGCILIFAAIWAGFTFHKEKPATSVILITRPAGMSARVDGITSKGLTPMSIWLQTGPHDILFSGDGYLDKEVSVEVAESPIEVNVDMKQRREQ